MHQLPLPRTHPATGRIEMKSFWYDRGTNLTQVKRAKSAKASWMTAMLAASGRGRNGIPQQSLHSLLLADSRTLAHMVPLTLPPRKWLAGI